MLNKGSKVLDIVLIGTGISGLNFIDKYTEKKNKILQVISPKDDQKKISRKKYKVSLLPSQMRGKYKIVENYFDANKINLSKNCKALGVLNSGGLSNYWGLQIDNYISNDQKNFNRKELDSLKKHYLEFVKKFNLLGSFDKKNLNYTYTNDYNIPEYLKKLLLFKNSKFNLKKPILAFSKKNFSGDINSINEKMNKLTADNLYKKINKKKIFFHKCYVEEIKMINNKVAIFCKDGKKKKILMAKKVVFASGTIATTKILMKFLKINREVKIKHHPRLLSVYFSNKTIDTKLSFTPSILQIISKSKTDRFTADIRPGNKFITDSIIDAFPYMRIFKSLINFFRKRLIFSNLLIDSSFSNLFLRKNGEEYKLYSKKIDLKNVLRSRHKKIFKFLKKEKIILPIYRTFFPGYGTDYHYFGSIPFKKYGKLSVNNKCQLRSYNNIFIVDGSVFDFKTNKYPLGIIAANARRIANLIS